MDVILFCISLFLLLVACLAFYRWVNKTIERVLSMLSRAIAATNELGKRLAELEERVDDLYLTSNSVNAQLSGYILDAEEVKNLRKDVNDISAQMEKIDFESVNKALKAQADFDEGFANILNFGLGTKPKE